MIRSSGTRVLIERHNHRGIKVPPPRRTIAEVKSDALSDAKRQVAESLGVRVGDLTADIERSLTESVDRQFETKVGKRAVNTAVSSALSKGSLKPALAELINVQDATLSLPELPSALEKNATLLFKTYSAFVTAGFTEEQAFQIILSQINRR